MSDSKDTESHHESPETIREEWLPAELPCPECGSEDYWYTPDLGPLTVHECLNCGYGGEGPGGSR